MLLYPKKIKQAEFKIQKCLSSVAKVIYRKVVFFDEM